MKRYRIHYIDGRDLRFKTHTTLATSRESAVRNLRDAYSDGDFDHQIIEIVEDAEFIKKNGRA